MTLDHIKPRSKSGMTNTSNLVPACGACNRSKASLEVFAWFRSTPHWSAKREADLLLWIHQPIAIDGGIPLLANIEDESDEPPPHPQPITYDPMRPPSS